jgi:hypothetical protein
MSNRCRRPLRNSAVARLGWARGVGLGRGQPLGCELAGFGGLVFALGKMEEFPFAIEAYA